ncbi:type II toxin-antitoxin system RelE/ParE family toxin [Sphingobacterium sp. DN00404]|uniref:Type II toxin-antitoxin system RelE/ParE family toxin n=1 Tax=Sphingobacterium micropteri TaxID=2763501 RepID=A0ABR7YS99_9SPHI|nr:type II toxin-antitoxin system RelE/ParE family toxin [Sphingobacterium micropteri]MBD1434227.1 type II toxin-antitoxin system RelE/ParE family toxin [Sphingobacterium micropteri]
MGYSVKSIEVFERQAKKLIKKYPSLKSEFLALIQELKGNPVQGTALGKSCYKIRLSIKSKGKGKSGGARIITNFVVANDTVYLLSVYDKSDKENISDKELDELLLSVPEW